MNRKLSATQILHGARAYSHNASRRAHQLSGPKRVRVMHGPVGNAALNDGIDSPCQHCGYQICNCGPCATCGEVPYYCNGTHAYEPPKPSARALDNLPAEPARAWRVGDRVRVVGAPFDGRVGAVSQITRFATFVVHLDGPKEGTQEYYHSADGSDLVAEPSPAGGRFHAGQRVRVVASPKLSDRSVVPPEIAGSVGLVTHPPLSDRRIGVTLDDGQEYSAGGAWYFSPLDLEPAPSPVSEAPTAESDEAVLKRCGWKPNRGYFDAPDGSRNHVDGTPTQGEWLANNRGHITWSPTLLQAACAALGITLLDNADHLDRDPWEAYLDGKPLECGPDAESCARAALEAWSRREPAQ